MNTKQIDWFDEVAPPTTPIDMWTWNGYNSVWVETHDRDSIPDKANQWKQASYNAEVVTVEDGEHLSVAVRDSYDFYGHRWSVTILTTRPGSFEPNEDDNLTGVWVPA